jgi:hypothetical protein
LLGYSFTSTNFLFLSSYQVSGLIFFPSHFADLMVTSSHVPVLFDHSASDTQPFNPAFARDLIPSPQAIEFSPVVALCA